MPKTNRPSVKWIFLATSGIISICLISFAIYNSELNVLLRSKPYTKYTKAMDDPELFELRLQEIFPSDIADYIDRYRMCLHWSGEPAYDAEREKEINNGIQETCAGLDELYNSFCLKYKKDPKKLSILNEAKKEIDNGETFPGFIYIDPDKTSFILTKYYESNAQGIMNTLDQQQKEYSAAIKNYRSKNTKEQSDIVDSCIFRLKVQARYMVKIKNNLDRLHPYTKARFIRYSKNLDKILSNIKEN